MAIDADTLTLKDPVKYNGKQTELSLLPDGGLRWRAACGSERCLMIENEVLGFAAEGSQLTVRAYVEKGGGFFCGAGRRHRERKDFIFEMSSEESRRIWSGKLKEYIDALGRPKRLFVVVNPFGGRKSALKIFHNDVHPLLVAADVQFTLQETQYQLHAKSLAHSLDLSKYDGIVCVSGDGVLVEVVNGFLQREDWAAAIKMPLGVIPAGTGNGMAKSLLDSANDCCSPANAVMTVIRGHRRSLDVATVLQQGKRFFSVLMLSWGLIADIDIESERYRWMGSSRLDFYCIVRILWLRKYQGHIFFVPAPGYEAFGEPLNQSGEACNTLDMWQQNQEANANVQQSGYQGLLSRFEKSEWRTIEGPFISVWLHNVPWGSEDTRAAPEAKFSDGFLDLIVMQNCPKSSLLGLMTKLKDGSHVKSPFVKYLKVKALQLEPGNRTGEKSKGGIIDSDGEVLARGEGTYKCGQGDLMAYGPPIQMTVDKGLATLFSPRS
ncbi:sphingosine kinase 1-like isoform X1 [Aristolochia californica]|uniref:sphingosine kinase 1-like isoform X1 n=2 Tax=Aristolochia californica TaxID=171875 RepID=UPI0035D6FF1F